MQKDNLKPIIYFAAGALIALSLAIASFAKASWPDYPVAMQPRAYSMSNKTVTRQTPGSASEVHVTLSKKGKCAEIYCSVGCLFLTSGSGSPATATASAGMDMASGTTRIQCLATTEDYISVWATAAGTVTVGEKNEIQ